MHPKPEFAELDYQVTDLGELSLRRRTILALDNREVHEILLGEAFLMSSLFTTVEVALSTLGLAATAETFPGEPLDVVVGGLGLGYTAKEALDHSEVGSIIVVDYLQPVIEWHQKGLCPLGPELTADSRCRFVHGDFFKLALKADGGPGFDPDAPDRIFHAILLDIDHSPANLLHDRHADFYQADGLRQLAKQIHPGGVFALWSDDPPEDTFMKALEEVFTGGCESHVIKFQNPLDDREYASTVYVARTA